MENQINKGSIVTYQGGFYRASNCTKNTVNLKSVFGNRVYFKSIKLTEVTESAAAFYEYWSKSETYQCM